MTEKRTMTADLVDVQLTFTDSAYEIAIDTCIGVLRGEWNDGLLDTSLDRKVYWWADNLEEIYVGAEFDDAVVSEICGSPYTETVVYFHLR